MVLGPGTFYPQGRFAAPRSYWRGIAFDISGYLVLDDANNYTWVKITDPLERWTITLKPEFWVWSSNRYTLDWVVGNFFYQLLPDPTLHPQPFTLNPMTRPDQPSRYIQFRWNGVDFGNFVYKDFPYQPPGYWLPKPFGE